MSSMHGENRSRHDGGDHSPQHSIHIKPSHKGLLHKELGVKGKISSSTLAKAKEHAGPAEMKRIVFAQNAKKFHHG